MRKQGINFSWTIKHTEKRTDLKKSKQVLTQSNVICVYTAKKKKKTAADTYYDSLKPPFSGNICLENIYYAYWETIFTHGTNKSPV